MYKQNVVISSIDVDQNLELKLSSLFKYMQLVASSHVESLNVGHQELFKHNLLWVVIRMEVKIYRTPKLDEEIVVTTHPGETRSFIYPRFFEIYDNRGNLIIAVSSLWTMIDKTTRRVVIKPEGITTIPAEYDENDLPLPEKVVGDTPYQVDSRRVRYTEIDLNGHLNNTEYIEFLLDTHDVNFYKSHRIVGININYDKEIKSGDVVDLLSNRQEPEIVRGKVGDTNHFTALLTYEKR